MRHRFPTISLMIIFLTACSIISADEVAVSDFDDIQLFSFDNDNGVAVQVTNYGATITSLKVPDRDGNIADIALGYNDVSKYMNAVDKPYFGAIVGRYGNRIAGGEFSLDGAGQEQWAEPSTRRRDRVRQSRMESKTA